MMPSNVIDMAARRKNKGASAPTRAFETIAAHLSSFEKDSKSRGDRTALSEEAAKLIASLEGELSKRGKGLRQRVESYLGIMAGPRRDELSGMSVFFNNPESGLSVTLSDGEAGKPAAKEKTDAIVKDCMAVAKSDLSFLKKMKKLLDSEGKSLSTEQIAKLGQILGRNSYWRHFESG